MALAPRKNFKIAQIGLASLRLAFDYLLPEQFLTNTLSVGIRVKVPFRKKQEIGVILGIREAESLPERKLKEVIEILDKEPLLTPSVLRLTVWASHYYHHPLGDCLINALPGLLRQGLPAQLRPESVYRITAAGLNVTPSELIRAPQQAVTLAAIKQHPEGCTNALLKKLHLNNKACLQALVKKGWVSHQYIPIPQQQYADTESAPLLNESQQEAVNTVTAALEAFHTFLLYGITGSGKTEVYLRIIEQTLSKKQQALVLVPEIGLTPQLIQRFQKRFKVKVIAMHSGLTNRERLNAWLMAKSGAAAIIIGTRSAIFTPMAKLGVIIVDEEHDPSFKQQESFRYNARDLAVIRGQMENLPVILGSATPSFESLYNVQQRRYQLLKLPERAGNAIHPSFKLIDIRSQQLQEGILSPLLVKAMNQHLADGGQILLFLNRRGYAPVLLCHHCGWIAHCKHCDTFLTFHQQNQQLECHHCDSYQKLYKECPQCHTTEIIPIGFGTERLEEALLKNYSQNTLLRIDRDSTRRKGTLEKMFTRIQQGESQILVGTQMLAKGHHFPNVTLVGILNADSGLYSSDFRAIERLAQMIIQVAGRAGRAEKPGEVLIQTHNPEHPLLQHLIQHGYLDFTKHALTERKDAGLPPFTHQVLLRAEAAKKELAQQFLTQAKAFIKNTKRKELTVLGPVSSLMEKKGGRYRQELLLQAAKRQPLQVLLMLLIPYLDSLVNRQQVRWSIDVDPIDLL